MTSQRMLKKSSTSTEIDQMFRKAQQASQMMKALSHESRLLLLCLLSEGEKSVTELENLLGERQSSVSQQLARLRLEQLVVARRDGKAIYYSLASDDVRRILGTIYDVFCGPPRGKKRR